MEKQGTGSPIVRWNAAASIGIGLAGVLLAVFLGCATGSSGRGKPVDYAAQVRPIFQQYCYECHGPIQVPSGKLRLDTREGALAGGRSGHPAIIPGDADDSPLVIAISGGDGETWRPMPRRGKKLGSREIEIIRRWIDQGAPYERD